MTGECTLRILICMIQPTKSNFTNAGFEVWIIWIEFLEVNSYIITIFRFRCRI